MYLEIVHARLRSLPGTIIVRDLQIVRYSQHRFLKQNNIKNLDALFILYK